MPEVPRPLIEISQNRRPLILVNTGEAILLNAQGELETNQRRITNAREIQLPTSSPRRTQRIRRTDERLARNSDILDVSRHSSNIELDLSRKNGTIELDIQPDPPGHLNISEDQFGPR